MALIISPKTADKHINQLSKYFDLEKVPEEQANLEFSNFNNNFYQAKVGDIPVYIILTGYGGASVGFAVAQYEKNYKSQDPYPVAYFLGSIIKANRAEIGDVLYAKETYGEDEWSQAIYKIAEKKNLKDIAKPDRRIVDKISEIAKSQDIKLKLGKILCRWHPGFLEDNKFVIDLLDEGMWWKFVLSEGEYENHDYDGGEIECASFTATCNLAGIPNVSLLYVRDQRTAKGYGDYQYQLADKENKKRAQENILRLLKSSILLLKE